MQKNSHIYCILSNKNIAELVASYFNICYGLFFCILNFNIGSSVSASSKTDYIEFKSKAVGTQHTVSTSHNPPWHMKKYPVLALLQIATSDLNYVPISQKLSIVNDCTYTFKMR